MTDGVNYHQLLKKYIFNNAFVHNIRLLRARMQVLENGSALLSPCFFLILMIRQGGLIY